MPESALIRDHPLIEEILGPHRAGLGEFYDPARSHAYRMLNWGRHLAPEEPFRDERLAIVAAFHDLPAFLDWHLEDYLERAADLAGGYLARAGHADWTDEIRLMIDNHHKVRSYRTPGGALVEATRRADWIEVSMGALRFGLPRDYLREIDAAFPLRPATYFRCMRKVGAYALRHPRRPLPMLRW